jgi:hypothetical protein
MTRERGLKVVLVLVGLLFVAAIYPMATSLWHPSPSDDTGDTMMMSLYFTLGILLLVAVGKPSAHRSLIAFTAWSSFAHAVVMTILGFHLPSDRVGFLDWLGRSRYDRRSAARTGSAKAVRNAGIRRRSVASHPGETPHSKIEQTLDSPAFRPEALYMHIRTTGRLRVQGPYPNTPTPYVLERRQPA